MGTLRWQNAVDFAVLAVAFYWLIVWARDARALRIAVGIAGVHAAALAASHFDLVITSWVLNGLAVVAVVLLVVVFQTELRRAIMRLDSRLLQLPLGGSPDSSVHQAIAEAAFAMARGRLGALVAVVRRDSVSELTDGGTTLGAEVSAPLLESVFQKMAPLHDGAVVVERNRMIKAGVVLPLTQRSGVPSVYGTRHRAAMGLVDRCDAVVVVVSEERGEARLMWGNNDRLLSGPEELVRLLADLTVPARSGLLGRARRTLFSNPGSKLLAGALAAVIWSMSVTTAGTAVRTVIVPVEFSNVPRSMRIVEQSASRLELQLRGRSWLMDSTSLDNLVARFDLRDARQGSKTLGIGPDTVALPPGIAIERMRPSVVVIHLEPRQR